MGKREKQEAGRKPARNGRKLHIGGLKRHKGWEVLNAVPGSHVDHVGNAKDLSRFEDGTFDQVYASHVLEHFSYNGDLEVVLKEWFRVLKPGGTLFVSVPDLHLLCRMFLDREHLTTAERFFVMNMMFGGQLDEYDFHYTGLDDVLLAMFLMRAGFVNLARVKGFGLFDDTSVQLFKGVPISCNMTAEKPRQPGG